MPQSFRILFTHGIAGCLDDINTAFISAIYSIAIMIEAAPHM